MILQALKEYYDRKAADPESQMAPPGWEWKEIPYIISLSAEGQPTGIQNTTEGSGKTKKTKRFLVPKGVKKTSGVAANLLWENPEYALGFVPTGGKSERIADQHAAFKERIAALSLSTDTGIAALSAFLDNPEKLKLLKALGGELDQLLEESANISFQLQGEVVLIPQREAVRNKVDTTLTTKDEPASICLVSGQMDATARLHSAIKGVWGAQTSGANIVSFNSPAFSSYGKEQGSNAPVGQKAAFAYSEALNHLLGKDSKQRIQVGDASTVFWSERPSELEQHIVDFFGEAPKDDPDRGVRAVESLLKAPQTGALESTDSANRFYVLGLAPNASRISIRFWMVDSVSGMQGKLHQHFEDLKIVHGPKDRDSFSLFRLLVCTATQGKSENIAPALAGETMRAILSGSAYPETLLLATLRRIRAEHEISHVRAALIKACLNRSLRLHNPAQETAITMSLDITNTNTGYRLGRLFATLERIQADANPGLNATIRDRFYGAASGTPATVFGNLMRLKNHHLSKLSNPGRRVNFEKLIGEIMSDIKDFPAHLNLADQGRFAIGYYHQAQDFFTKKSDQS